MNHSYIYHLSATLHLSERNNKTWRFESEKKEIGFISAIKISDDEDVKFWKNVALHAYQTAKMDLIDEKIIYDTWEAQAQFSRMVEKKFEHEHYVIFMTKEKPEFILYRSQIIMAMSSQRLDKNMDSLVNYGNQSVPDRFKHFEREEKQMYQNFKTTYMNIGLFRHTHHHEVLKGVSVVMHVVSANLWSTKGMKYLNVIPLAHMRKILLEALGGEGYELMRSHCRVRNGFEEKDTNEQYEIMKKFHNDYFSDSDRDDEEKLQIVLGVWNKYYGFELDMMMIYVQHLLEFNGKYKLKEILKEKRDYLRKWIEKTWKDKSVF